MHFGTGPAHSTFSECDPYILDEQLSEIETCAQVSKSVFFLVSIQQSASKAFILKSICTQLTMYNKKFKNNFV